MDSSGGAVVGTMLTTLWCVVSDPVSFAGRNKEAETARVDKELANIRRQFTTSKVQGEAEGFHC